MKILRIADVPDNRTGGMSRFMHFISDELRASGHEVECLFRDAIGDAVGGRMRRFWTPLRVVQIVRAAQKSRGPFDVVEIHEPSAALYCQLRRFDRSLPPAVVVSYGIESRGRDLMLKYMRAKGKPPSLKERYSAKLTVLWQADMALRRADAVTVESSEDVEYATRVLGVPEDRIVVVNGGVSQRFLDCEDGPSPGAGVLFLASWLERKGVPDLIAALTRVIRSEPSARVTIAGCGVPEEVVRRAFPEDCRELLHVVPHIPDEEALVAQYRRHSIFLAPSVFEGQLLTMLEAAAAGLALVCSNTCGMRDFVRNGESGILHEVGDADALANATLSLLRDPNQAARLGLEAQRDARRFRWSRSAEQFLDAASRAVSNGAKRKAAPCPA